MKTKTVIDRLKRRKYKREQLLMSFCPENMALNNDSNELEQFYDSCDETPINEIQTLSNSSCQISFPEAENGDDDNDYDDNYNSDDNDGDDNDCDSDDDDNDLDPKVPICLSVRCQLLTKNIPVIIKKIIFFQLFDYSCKI